MNKRELRIFRGMLALTTVLNILSLYGTIPTKLVTLLLSVQELEILDTRQFSYAIMHWGAEATSRQIG